MKENQNAFAISLAEIKLIQFKHGVFQNFAISQPETSINYKEIFICSDIKQSESTFNGHGIFNKFNVNQPKLSSTSDKFFKNFDIVCRYQGFFHR